MSTNRVDYLYLGRNAEIYDTAKIVNPSRLFVDDYSVIGDFCFVLATKYVKIGKYTHLAPYSMISGGGEVYIYDFVEISYGVKIISGTDDIFGENLFTPSVPVDFRNVQRASIEIGSLSFIGANSIIYPGVKIGEGVIVNPGSVIKSNLKAWHIYEDSDDNPIGKRKHKDELIKKAESLLNSKKR